MSRIDPWGGTKETEGPLSDDEIADQDILRRIDEAAKKRGVSKGSTPKSGKKDGRRKP